VDSFLAFSLEGIEVCFTSQQIDKFVYVFVAQCIYKEVPPFCLGTNNSFTATEVLKRWKYIYSEFHKQKITVISFGGDEDSRVS